MRASSCATRSRNCRGLSVVPIMGRSQFGDEFNTVGWSRDPEDSRTGPGRAYLVVENVLSPSERTSTRRPDATSTGAPRWYNVPKYPLTKYELMPRDLILGTAGHIDHGKTS